MNSQSLKVASRQKHIGELQTTLSRPSRNFHGPTAYHIHELLGSSIFRLVEIIISVAVIIVGVIPLYLSLGVASMLTGKKTLLPKRVSGIKGNPITVNYFNVDWPLLRCTPLFLSVLSGDLSLVGRSITDFISKEINMHNAYSREMKPGIFSLWNVRENTRIGHEGCSSTEWEYRFTQGVKSDIGLFFRTIPAHLFSTTTIQNTDTNSLFGISFSNTTMREAVQVLEQELTNSNTSQSVFFVNPDCFNKTFRDDSYHNILKKGDHVFPDGIGLVIAGKILGNPLKENVNGTDMLPYLCKMAASNNKSLFLLGGATGVAKTMRKELENRFNVTVAGTHNGFFDHENENTKIIEKINNSGADIVLVAFGAPLQEKWIDNNIQHLNAKIVMGVGGLFDFYSGNTKRAPRWLREIGLEWSYRLLQEPGRMWQRYVIGNPLFLWRVITWKLSGQNKRY